MSRKYTYKVLCSSPPQISQPSTVVYNIDRKPFGTYATINLPLITSSSPTCAQINKYSLSTSATTIVAPDVDILKFEPTCTGSPCQNIQVLTGDDSSLTFPYTIDFYTHLETDDIQIVV